MIHYELALQLKEAGFPQAGKGDLRNENGLPPMLAHAFSLEGEYGNFVYFPTITELIDACGDDFKSLRKHDPLDESMHGFILAHGGYSAEMHDRDLSTFKNTIFGGRTKEEAVANLYLELRRLNNHEIQQK